MIHVVGLGPGGAPLRTAAATAAIDRSDVVVGYAIYVDLIRDEFPEKPVFVNGMTGEVERCREALRLSREGKTVAVVCSGDASVYGMASLILELSVEADEVEILPGVTAALAASAALGAPLSGDLAIVSLSDLLTPWSVIEKRLSAAGLGDFPVALYNPASRSRRDYLQRAADILLRHKPGDTPCGWVRNIAREGQEKKILTLANLRDEKVDMFTTVVVGNSQTILKGGRLVTPRGYRT
jgi:precorrin-3B C17-methyltransferase